MDDLETPVAGRPMYRYQAFGGLFLSDLEFPELQPGTSEGSDDWVLERADEDEGVETWTALGSSPVEEGVGSTLFQRARDGALRLVYDDTGTFEIDPTGRRIRWSPPGEVDVIRARKDVLGRVFALVFHQGGLLTLHGSAVAMGREGVCFLAPKFHGKSTTAAALVDAGATLLADDLVVITTDESGGGSPSLLPTLSTVHLWPDAAEEVGRRAVVVEGQDDQAKVQVSYAPASSGTDSGAAATPLRAVYLLAPTDEVGRTVSRVALPSTVAAMALLGQLKVGDLLGPRSVLDLLPGAVGLAGRVGMYRLHVPRDLTRLPELVEQLQKWHPGVEAS